MPVATEREPRQEWAQAERLAIIERLGGQCATCGTKKRLEIHHPDGRSYSLRELSYAQRVDRYLKEEKAGLLGVLCRNCNARDWS